MPGSHAPTVLFQTYTPKTFAPFDGKDGGRILLTINGIVFGVTAGHEFIDLVRTRWNFSEVEVGDVAKGVCMATLRVGTPLRAWPSSLLIWVCSGSYSVRCITQLPSLGNVDPEA